MKRKILVLALTLAAALSCAVWAQAAEEGGQLYDVQCAAGYELTLLDAEGNEVAESEEEAGLYCGVSKLGLAFDGEEENEYVVFLLSGESSQPTAENIRYIDQKSGEDEMEFLLYPDQMEQAGNYAVYVSSFDGYGKAADFKVKAAAVKISSQPADAAVKAGEKAVFAVTAAGEGLTYQWEYLAPGGTDWKSTSFSGNKTNTLTVTTKTTHDGYQYRCAVTGNGVTVYSEPASLSVVGIKTSPADATVRAGEKAKFTVEATGSNISYQWQYKSTKMTDWGTTTFSGNKTKTLTVSAQDKHNGYQYRCEVTDGTNTVYSEPAVLTVSSFAITAQPEDTAVKSGKKAVFTVETEGEGLTYQWQYRKSSSDSWKSTTFSGAKTATLTVSAKTTHDGYQYRCAVTGNGTTVYSEPASLSVVGIKKAPVDATVGVGEKAKFTVQATGSNISYQWQYRKSAEDIWKSTTFSGNKTATLTVTAKAYHDGYQYRCKVTDGTNSAWSAAATLTVNSFAITAQPDDTAVKVGGKAVFAVETTGEDLTYQWQYRKSSSDSWKSTTFSGAKTDTLTVTAKAYHDGYQYRCKISDGTDTVYSEAAELSVLAITAQPEDVTAEYGSKVTFEVEAQGDGLTYQWRYRTSESGSWANSTVTSAKTAALSVTAYNKYDGYQYRCTVKDAHGNTVYSSIVTLTVE